MQNSADGRQSIIGIWGCWLPQNPETWPTLHWLDSPSLFQYRFSVVTLVFSLLSTVSNVRSPKGDHWPNRSTDHSSLYPIGVSIHRCYSNSWWHDRNRCPAFGHLLGSQHGQKEREKLIFLFLPTSHKHKHRYWQRSCHLWVFSLPWGRPVPLTIIFVFS